MWYYSPRNHGAKRLVESCMLGILKSSSHICTRVWTQRHPRLSPVYFPEQNAPDNRCMRTPLKQVVQSKLKSRSTKRGGASAHKNTKTDMKGSPSRFAKPESRVCEPANCRTIFIKASKLFENMCIYTPRNPCGSSIDFQRRPNPDDLPNYPKLSWKPQKKRANHNH